MYLLSVHNDPAEDLDEPLDWAARGSKVCRGRVEVRAFDDDAG
jgi:hypothetical protein